LLSVCHIRFAVSRGRRLPGEGHTVNKPTYFTYMKMAMNKDNAPGVRIPGNRLGGTMVPGSPRPGSGAASVQRRDQSLKGPKPVAGLPAGSPIGWATADEREDNLVKSIVDKYLGSDEVGTAVPGGSQLPIGFNDDAMSVSSMTGSIRTKRGRADSDSAGDSDVISRPHRGHKVLRSRVIGAGSDSDGPRSDPPIVLSDSPE